MNVTLKKTYSNKKVLDAIKNMESRAVKVGVLAGTGVHKYATKNQTVAMIAFWNEFGTKRSHARPFMRPALRQGRNNYERVLKNGLKKILLAKVKSETVLAGLGTIAQDDIQNMISKIMTPGLSERTIAQRKKLFGSTSTKPLIASGELRSSIKWALVK